MNHELLEISLFATLGVFSYNLEEHDAEVLLFLLLIRGFKCILGS